MFLELAEKANATIELEEVPLLFPEFSEFATRFFLMPNATVGTNGAFVIACHKSIAEDVTADLRREGLDPRFVGRVSGKGVARLGHERLLEELEHLKELARG